MNEALNDTCEQAAPQRRELPAQPRLYCPLCGRSQSLRGAEGLPAGIMQVICPCPECEGHETTRPVFVDGDGSVIASDTPQA